MRGRLAAVGRDRQRAVSGAANPPRPDKTGAMQLTSVEDLRGIYRPPAGAPVDKVIHRLDAHCVDFIAKAPFFVLSTANADGVCDGSPKGGSPGFVQVLDDQRLAWADFSGNNRLDSFENLVANDSVALLFLIPGLDETLRVNGRAQLVVDPELCERFAVGGRPARVVVVVTVAEAYIHCAKALRRAGLWSSETWLDRADLPSASCIVRDHAKIDVEVAVIEEHRQRDLATTLWQPGGDAK
jgi:PPOX class probable FMN-dependent enzyme